MFHIFGQPPIYLLADDPEQVVAVRIQKPTEQLVAAMEGREQLCRRFPRILGTARRQDSSDLDPDTEANQRSSFTTRLDASKGKILKKFERDPFIGQRDDT